jgi:hypothetical protein
MTISIAPGWVSFPARHHDSYLVIAPRLAGKHLPSVDYDQLLIPDLETQG